jgi:hypothetical protein
MLKSYPLISLLIYVKLTHGIHAWCMKRWWYVDSYVKHLAKGMVIQLNISQTHIEAWCKKKKILD